MPRKIEFSDDLREYIINSFMGGDSMITISKNTNIAASTLQFNLRKWLTPDVYLEQVQSNRSLHSMKAMTSRIKRKIDRMNNKDD
jgi:hypothetical protein